VSPRSYFRLLTVSCATRFFWTRHAHFSCRFEDRFLARFVSLPFFRWFPSRSLLREEASRGLLTRALPWDFSDSPLVVKLPRAGNFLPPNARMRVICSSDAAALFGKDFDSFSFSLRFAVRDSLPLPSSNLESFFLRILPPRAALAVLTPNSLLREYLFHERRRAQ